MTGTFRKGAVGLTLAFGVMAQGAGAATAEKYDLMDAVIDTVCLYAFNRTAQLTKTEDVRKFLEVHEGLSLRIGKNTTLEEKTTAAELARDFHKDLDEHGVRLEAKKCADTGVYETAINYDRAHRLAP